MDEGPDDAHAIDDIFSTFNVNLAPQISSSSGSLDPFAELFGGISQDAFITP